MTFRKMIIIVFFPILMVAICCSTASFFVRADNVKVYFDGEMLSLCTEPIINEDSVYLPASDICNAFGAAIEIDDMEGKFNIHMAEATIEMKEGIEFVNLNHGTIIELDNSPLINGDEMMISLSLIKDVIKADVKYNAAKKIISIDYFSTMKGTLRIGGSENFTNTCLRVVKSLKEINPDFKATVMGGGSTSGFQACVEGIYDIANMSRTLTPDEKYKNEDVVVNKIACEGIAIVVNKDNPVDSIEWGDIVRIYTGIYDNWDMVKGEDKPIFVNIQEPGSSTLSTFYDVGIKPLIEDKKAIFTDTAMPHTSNGLSRQAVTEETLSIGFISFPFIDDTVKAIKVSNIEPNKESVLETNLKKRWIYTCYLSMVTNGEPSELSAKFINYVRSAKGREVIEEEGLFYLDNFYIDDKFLYTME